MRCLFFALISLHLTRMASTKIDYCGAKMCGNSDMHTFCQYSDKPGEMCIGFMPAPLTEKEKIKILSRINHRRNDAALGLLGSLPTAADMVTMRWVRELEREALYWANQCSPPEFPGRHDMCRDLYSIPVGQNVASVIGEAPGLRVESMVDLWYMQGRNYNGKITSYLPPPYNRSYYGDFAQMLWSPTFMVGCARTKFMSIWHGRGRNVERLVCNMAPRGPRSARPLWTPGQPASRCPPRTHPSTEYTGLCTPSDIKTFDDKKNQTSLKHAILLSTLAEIDRNSSIDYVGKLDEFYLMKLAALTLEHANKIPHANRSKTLEAIANKLGVKLSDYNNIIIKRIDNERRRIRRYLGKPKRKLRIIGRPKAYYLYELIKEEDNSKNTEYINTSLKTDNVNENFENAKHDDKKDVSPLGTTTITLEIINETSAEIDTDVSNTSTLNDYISNEDDDSEISDKLIEDYLSNPETAREIQEQLLRSEESVINMATANLSSDSTDSSIVTKPVPASTRNKVRRELREMEDEKFEKFKRDLKNSLQLPEKYRDNDDPKVVVKGTMVDSLINYLPNLRNYGLPSAPGLSTTCRVTPSFSLTLLSFYTVL